MKPLTGKCALCKKPRRSDTIFCSRKCEQESKRLIYNKWVFCETCGACIEKLKSRLKRYKRIFCDEKCQREGFKLNPPKKGNGFWYEKEYRILHAGKGKGIKEHIKIMQDHIGRKLRKDEVVHHIDENRSNNDLSNLQLMTRSEHTSHHRKKKIHESLFPEIPYKVVR